MTIPIVRKRAKRPKTRTGCLTCRARHVKCDEGRPTCRRCILSHKECQGYELLSHPGPRKTHAILLPAKAQLPPPELSSLPRTPSTLQRAMCSAEISAFDFFRLYTMHQLPGCSWSISWDKLVLQTALREPAARHAVVALASIHRAITMRESKSPNVDAKQHQFALDQYTKSIAYIKTYISALDSEMTYSESSLEVILLVSLLFFCFELLYCEDVKAATHLYTGLRILHERMQHAIKPTTSQREITVHATPRTSLAILARAFIELDYDGCIEAPENMTQPYLRPMCRERMPLAFSTVDEALVHFYALWGPLRDFGKRRFLASRDDVGRRVDLSSMNNYTRECLINANLRRLDITIDPDLEDDCVLLKRRLNNWQTAFTNLQSSERDRPAYTMAQIQFFSMWFIMETHGDVSETAVDRFSSHFEHIASVCEAFITKYWSIVPHTPFNPELPSINTRPAFSFGTGLVTCLYTVAMRYRNTRVRRKCIQLLRSLNLQGAFDSFYLAGMIEAVVDVEEKCSRQIMGIPDWIDLECHDVPEEARIIEADFNMEDDFDEHVWYKEDLGSFVYFTWAAGAGSELEKGGGVFVVNRPPPSGGFQ